MMDIEDNNSASDNALDDLIELYNSAKNSPARYQDFAKEHEDEIFENLIDEHKWHMISHTPKLLRLFAEKIAAESVKVCAGFISEERFIVHLDKASILGDKSVLRFVDRNVDCSQILEYLVEHLSEEDIEIADVEDFVAKYIINGDSSDGSDSESN